MYKLGRHPRAFDPRIVHLSPLMAMRSLPPPPASVNYSHGMPAHIGMMLNDTLGDCTCAAPGHAVQVWSFNAQKKLVTPTDQEILGLYEKTCGYDPSQTQPDGSNPTDQGGNMQTVQNWLMKNGIPLPGGGTTKVLLWVEVDVRNKLDVMRIIDECGVCNIGFNVPQYLLPQDGSPPPRQWIVNPGADNTIIGGHDVVLVGYDQNMITLASWGGWYQMSWGFFEQFCDEAYGIACQMWVEKTGKTPAGLTLQQMETLMRAVKNP